MDIGVFQGQDTNTEVQAKCTGVGGDEEALSAFHPKFQLFADVISIFLSSWTTLMLLRVTLITGNIGFGVAVARCTQALEGSTNGGLNFVLTETPGPDQTMRTAWSTG